MSQTLDSVPAFRCASLWKGGESPVKSIRTSALGSVIAASVLWVAACAGGSSDPAVESVSVTPSASPTFEAQEVAPITAPSRNEVVHDDGLNVDWELQGNSTGNAGGTIITVKLHNLNDVALPTDAIGDPTLTLSDGSEAERMDANDAGIAGMDGLDLPLGAGASVNLRYAFNTSNLTGASFSIGNVTWENI